MQYTNLGSSGLYVSRLCLGAMMFGATITEQKEVTAVVDKALEEGINFIDTANVYNGGASEEMLGKAIKGRRDDLIIASKAYFSGESEPHKAYGSSRKGLMKEIDDSLKRLGTDYIDLYQLHSFDHYTPLEETLSALDELVKSGKVRNIGHSNFSGWQIAKAQMLAEMKGYEKFCSSQSHYALTCRDIEHEILPACKDANLGLMIWSPLSGGFLTGKYTRDGEGEGRRAAFALPPIDSRYCFDILDVVIAVAEKHQTTPANIANAWLLHQAGVSSVIVGVSSLKQLEQNLGALNVALDDDDLAKLNQVSEPAIMYPAWSKFSTRGEYNPELIAAIQDRVKNNPRNSALGAGEAV